MKKKVVMIMSTGGLRWTLHAQFLKLWEELKFPTPDEIWGASAGAAAGCLYASGVSPLAMEEFALTKMSMKTYGISLYSAINEWLPWGHSLATAGLVSSRKVEVTMKDLIARQGVSWNIIKGIRCLPFYCTAHNVSLMEDEVLGPDSCDIVSRAIASMSIPGVFEPKKLVLPSIDTSDSDGNINYYIDGGVFDGYPLYSMLRSIKENSSLTVPFPSIVLEPAEPGSIIAIGCQLGYSGEVKQIRGTFEMASYALDRVAYELFKARELVIDNDEELKKLLCYRAVVRPMVYDLSLWDIKKIPEAMKRAYNILKPEMERIRQEIEPLLKEE